MRPTSVFAWQSLLAVVALVVAACGSPSAPTPPPQTTGGATAAPAAAQPTAAAAQGQPKIEMRFAWWGSQDRHNRTIKAIELVTLPAKNKVLELLPSDDVVTNYDNITLVWSPDSNWCAFYYNQPRVGYSSVYGRCGDKFVEVTKRDDLRVDVKGNVRNEYVQPIRWTKPGVLLLEQVSIFRGAEIDDAKFQLTAAADPRTGKFKVISKKKLPPDVKKED